MRIGFDLISLPADYVGGVTTFATGLLRGLVAARGNHTIQVYLSEDNRNAFESAFYESSNVEFIIIPEKYKRVFPSKYLESVVSLAKAAVFLTGLRSLYRIIHNVQWRRVAGVIDRHSDITIYPLVHLPTYNIKSGKLVCLHDIQQVHFPQFFTRLDLHSRRIRYYLSAHGADYVQASSNFMKEDFMSYFEFLQPRNLVVIPEGVDRSVYRKRSPEAVCHVIGKFNLPKDYILYPAQLWHHKNHLRLLMALKAIAEEHKTEICLVLTGAEKSSAGEVKRFIDENGMGSVFCLGAVDREDLLALYSGAKLLVMPSLFESSSLPVLEAISIGVPVAASKIPALVEQSETYSIELFSPESVEEMAQAIFDLYSHPEKANSQVEANSGRVDQSDWVNIAKRYVSFLESKV